jgi:hypothetical protein
VCTFADESGHITKSNEHQQRAENQDMMEGEGMREVPEG